MLGYFFGGKKEEQIKAKVEDSNPQLAMQAALDTHGDFEMEEDGTLAWKSTVVMRVVMMRQAHREMYRTYRTELDERRRSAYRLKQDEKYVHIIRETD